MLRRLIQATAEGFAAGLRAALKRAEQAEAYAAEAREMLEEYREALNADALDSRGAWKRLEKLDRFLSSTPADSLERMRKLEGQLDRARTIAAFFFALDAEAKGVQGFPPHKFQPYSPGVDSQVCYVETEAR